MKLATVKKIINVTFINEQKQIISELLWWSDIPKPQ